MDYKYMCGSWTLYKRCIGHLYHSILDEFAQPYHIYDISNRSQFAVFIP